MQTGGRGRTWKRYVDPRGGAGLLYHGMIRMNGYSAGYQWVPIRQVIGRRLSFGDFVWGEERANPDAPETLALGYKDDDYSDNGYYRHDDGTEDQCRGVGPAWVTVTIDRAIEPITAPRVLSPANGTVFSHYPRTTTLRWERVPGAMSYTVQIDCFHCCEVNRWCTDVGDPGRVVRNVRALTYTFEFGGAQPGRWRVWGVSSNGEEGPKSEWWEFRYTQ